MHFTKKIKFSNKGWAKLWDGLFYLLFQEGKIEETIT